MRQSHRTCRKRGPPASRHVRRRLRLAAKRAVAWNTMTNPESILDVHDVTVAYHRRPVLWNIDWTLREPALVGIVGPNGAGKSTLLKAILGLAPLTSGRVTLFGEPLDRVRGCVAYVPQ